MWLKPINNAITAVSAICGIEVAALCLMFQKADGLEMLIFIVIGMLSKSALYYLMTRKPNG